MIHCRRVVIGCPTAQAAAVSALGAMLGRGEGGRARAHVALQRAAEAMPMASEDLAELLRPDGLAVPRGPAALKTSRAHGRAVAVDIGCLARAAQSERATCRGPQVPAHSVRCEARADLQYAPPPTPPVR